MRGEVVSKLRKLLEKIRNNPKFVRFDELDKILLRYGFAKRQPSSGSSHYIYKLGTIRLTIPFKQPYIKAPYVEQALNALEGVIDDEKNA
jgi:hypothetical protein